MNWKIERDPYMSALAERWGEVAVWEGGFFEDDDDRDAPLDDVGWTCTPVAHVRAGLAASDALGTDRVPVVLVSTGGFWPPHEGHLEMIERARVALEATGSAVIAGYLSPGHDQYLRLKWGAVAPPAAARVAMLDQLIGDRSWLAVDTWEAQHRRVSVNFTDVVARLEAYLRARVDPRIEVCFVCGGDNARFALPFAASGRCAVVDRPGSSDEVARWRVDPRVASSERVVWVEGGHAASSRSMDPDRWQPAPVTSLRLRLEDDRAVAGLGLGPDRWRDFQAALLDRLARDRRVTTVRVGEQRVDTERRVISLDPFTPGDVDFGVSRLFDVGGRRQLGHVERPGFPPMMDQARRVPRGEYVIVDDDSMTGATMAVAANELPPDVHVVASITLMEPLAGEGDGEIADSRDFLVGTTEGGLVVQLPDGSRGRAPYLLPYVDPHARCGVAAGDVLAFSIDVWRLNAAAFEGTGLRIGDLPGPARGVFLDAGRDGAELLEDLCRWHAERLASFDGGDR